MELVATALTLGLSVGIGLTGSRAMLQGVFTLMARSAMRQEANDTAR